MNITPVHKAIKQSRRGDSTVPRYKHQLTRHKYDDAYVMGYHNGYHAVKYDNQYDEDTQAQYWIKFKHGYTAGKLMRVKEEAAV